MENLELLKIENERERREILARLELEDAIQIKIANKEEEIKKLKAESEKSRQDLLNNMIKYDIKTLELKHFIISRVDETKRVTIDSKALKANEPEIFKKYSKSTNIKAYLRFTVKKTNLIKGSE